MNCAVVRNVTLCVACAAAFHAPRASAEELADIIERGEKSVVRINVETAKGGGIGSGFIVSATSILTNFHVIQGAIAAEVEFADGKTVRITGFFAADPARDVALLACVTAGHPSIRLSNELPRKGELLINDRKKVDVSRETPPDSGLKGKLASG